MDLTLKDIEQILSGDAVTDFFYLRQKFGVKIGLCALTFCPIKIGQFLPTICLR